MTRPTAAALMPAAFIGHGSPMNAIEHNRYTESWRAFGASVPRPRAILVISAHWYINATAVTAMPRPKTIHDFYGFPQQLFDVEYNAPGLPELADEVSEAVKPTWVGADIDSWGIDHGTWSVLVHAFPKADVPVVQLAINAAKPLDYHVELGAALAPLRETGVLVLGSGNIVHNLGGMNPQLVDEGYDWAHRFDDAARATLIDAPDQIATLCEHRDFHRAVPTPDHFIPMVYLAGLAAAEKAKPAVLVEGYGYGSLSMTSYTLDSTVPRVPAGSGGAGSLPDGLPPDETNL